MFHLKKDFACLLAALLLCVLSACGTADVEADSSVAPSASVVQSSSAQAAEPSSDAQPISSSEAEQKEEQPSYGLFAEGYAAAREELDTMTLEEKVAQMFLFRCPAEDALDTVRQYQPGGFMLFARDFDGKTAEQVRAELDAYQQASEIPMLLAVDEEGGTVVRVSRKPMLAEKPFRSPQAVFQSGGMEGITEDTLQKVKLLQSLGINVNFAPDADVSTDPSDFIYARSFGKEGRETADFVKTSVLAYNSQKMACTLKHFPGYGNNVDTHTGVAVDQRPYETFEQEDFLPFAAGIEAGAPMVLVSHNIVECMDPDRPASLSPQVHEILRDKLGFTGLILTDDLSMQAIPSYTDGENPCPAAVNAGNDLLLSSSIEADYRALLTAVQDGVVSEERLDESVLRILAMKYSTALYDLERNVE
ncbi:glycoside hydrolase family 3 N-terminal domain-containing protein [Clostridium sp. D33t1_170424_F3]|uniref:glycoside hydrolase family 3 protein n=1 Tax=Clostridium sp. D33t1_170424_F3 TaxID=2787099 RepID=UPI0018ABD84E|nr:glycoside hydrolase family 3 N-terminal domain-containing protein [Clostridium sp. D33t1_170424_F3]